ncbi:MAG TPA: amidohydrolase family protein [Chryseolinea sp.]
MKTFLIPFSLLIASTLCGQPNPNAAYHGEVFDTHLHGHFDVDKRAKETKEYAQNNITRAAITCPWNTQQPYRAMAKPKFLYGMIFPCPNGIVPYGGPKCFENGKDFPDPQWVRQQIRDHKIDFLGELVNEYYGISMSDSVMFPYYALAQEFNIPIGMHSGLAGPDHGCPNFDPLMGDPQLLKDVLVAFPKLKVWLMHAGAPYLKGTLDIMSAYPTVYADVSVIANPDIVTKDAFYSYMKSLVDAGLTDRLMFGSDGGDISRMIGRVNELDFLTKTQKEDIFHKNAERFFGGTTGARR